MTDCTTKASRESTTHRNRETRITIPKTTIVVCVVSFRVGQTTFRASVRTSTKYCFICAMRSITDESTLLSEVFPAAKDPSGVSALIKQVLPLSLSWTNQTPHHLHSTVSVTTTTHRQNKPADGQKTGRTGGSRTHNRRFWRPMLCQLSYCPIGSP